MLRKTVKNSCSKISSFKWNYRELRDCLLEKKNNLYESLSGLLKACFLDNADLLTAKTDDAIIIY